MFVAETSLSSNETSPGGVLAYIWSVIKGFFVALFTFAISLLYITKRTQIPESNSAQTKKSDVTTEPISKEESWPPSPVPEFSKPEVLSSALKRLGELEEKVDMLQSKPIAMPYEKEELLNAAVYRVDALEAELIATKKVTYLIFLSDYLILKTYFLLTSKKVIIEFGISFCLFINKKYFVACD